jgi:hypothetical protein
MHCSSIQVCYGGRRKNKTFQEIFTIISRLYYVRRTYRRYLLFYFDACELHSYVHSLMRKLVQRYQLCVSLVTILSNLKADLLWADTPTLR